MKILKITDLKERFDELMLLVDPANSNSYNLQ